MCVCACVCVCVCAWVVVCTSMRFRCMRMHVCVIDGMLVAFGGAIKPQSEKEAHFCVQALLLLVCMYRGRYAHFVPPS